MPNRVRLKPEMRRAHIVRAAYKCANRHGLYYFNTEQVAKEAKVSRPLVSHYFSADQLRSEVIQKAMDEQNQTLVSTAIMMNHPLTKKLTAKQRGEYLKNV